MQLCDVTKYVNFIGKSHAEITNINITPAALVSKSNKRDHFGETLEQ